MRLLIILVLAWLPSLSLGQVFNLDTTHTNGAPHVGELIFANGDKYIGTRSSLAKYQLDNTAVWGYGIGSSNNCLHNNSRFKDLALLSNGSLAGIFYHDESCITPESAFVMLDSNGNVLVDKRFAKGISLQQAGIIEKDSLVHLYGRHYIPSTNKSGIFHYRFNPSGTLIDSLFRLTDFVYFNGPECVKYYNDSIIISGFTREANGIIQQSMVISDINLSDTFRIILSSPKLGYGAWHLNQDSIHFIFGKNKGLNYRIGIGKMDIEGKHIDTITTTLGSKFSYSDLIKIGRYFVVTEYETDINSKVSSLILFDNNLKLVFRQLLNFQLTQDFRFIKTSDSTFLIYDDSYTYEYTMNFDSIPGYVSSVSNLVATNGSELELKVFPNPSASMVTITYPASPQTRVRVFSVSGVELIQYLVTNSTETTIDLSQYPKGIYLLQVKTNRGMKTVKLVRE